MPERVRTPTAVPGDRNATDENYEKFVLDARLTGVLDSRAFRAVLVNGHALVVYCPHGWKATSGCDFKLGDVVQVCMSPYDMNRGEIIVPQENDHEG